MVLGNDINSITVIISFLIDICGSQYVVTNLDELYNYQRDETLDLSFPFDVLVKPGSVEEISEILKIGNQYKIPVTPRGGGSGVTGGALPVKRGIVLSLERLNKIITVNKVDNYVISEAGVITKDLCDAVEEKGLYFPVAPSSKAYSLVGGNVAENAGSINSCKYGVTAQYVINLEVVLPNGEIIWTGANVSKNVTGLNLTQLFIGSEGILGIITKVVYKLVCKPKYTLTLLAGFSNLEDAYNAVIEIKQSFIVPSALEFLGENALKLTSAYLNEPLPLVKEGVITQLIISLQDNSESILIEHSEVITSICEKYSKEEILVGTTEVEQYKIWKLRLNIGSALTHNNKIYRDIDICMPLSKLYTYIKTVEEICENNSITLTYFGHILDGNLHMMLSLDENYATNTKIKTAIMAIYDYAIKNGGAISGEHGIGVLQKEFMPLQYSKPYLNLLQNIKNSFDPNGILNPGKIF